MDGIKKWQDRSKKVKISLILILIVLVIAGVTAFVLFATGVLGTKKDFKNSNGQNRAVTVSAGANEEILYATLSTVRGNEITYLAEDATDTTTALIPVGTKVTTKLGTETTFSRLAAGDNVALVMNKNTGEIASVYIVQ